mmetsp:Transcript_12270/g.19804  ORF Transcript_12270/g.19804 Transcript_12270/m.19804 type:complete len:163 (-) Transcript_12270:2701-3189(-)
MPLLAVTVTHTYMYMIEYVLNLEVDSCESEEPVRLINITHSYYLWQLLPSPPLLAASDTKVPSHLTHHPQSSRSLLEYLHTTLHTPIEDRVQSIAHISPVCMSVAHVFVSASLILLCSALLCWNISTYRPTLEQTFQYCTDPTTLHCTALHSTAPPSPALHG